MKIIQILSGSVGADNENYHEIYALGDDGAMYQFKPGRLATARNKNYHIINTDQVTRALAAGETVHFQDAESTGWERICGPGEMSRKTPHPLDPTRHERS